MADDATGSRWLHYTGECVDGPMAGRSLPIVDTTLTTWKSFRELHPDGTVVEQSPSRLLRLLGRFNGAREGAFFLPSWFRRTMRKPTGVAIQDKEFGLGVVLGRRGLLLGERVRAARFYPFSAVKARGFVQDRLDDKPIVLLWDEDANSTVAFLASLGGEERRYHLEGGVVDDRGNRMAPNGSVTSGPDRGERLTVLPAIATRWYGFHQTYPDASVFT